jgi:hypothetical protein
MGDHAVADLNIRLNRLSDAMLQVNRFLRVIRLPDNYIGDLAMMVLGNVLKSNIARKHIDLAETEISVPKALKFSWTKQGNSVIRVSVSNQFPCYLFLSSSFSFMKQFD